MHKKSVCISYAKNLGQKFWKDWVRPMAVTAAVILPIKSSLADCNFVPTGSMKPTILEGDMLVVNKLAYDLKIPFTLKRLAKWSSPVKGDVVVLFSPKDGTRLVKRVVGEPGDSIELRNNTLILNDTPVDYSIESSAPFLKEIYEDPNPVIAEESLADHPHHVMALPNRSALRNFPKTVVPDGSYFVMGDSRDNSFDSRFFGFVPEEQIVGRTRHVLISADKNHYFLPRFDRFFSDLD